MTNLLAANPGRIAIFGWHRLNGVPIQPLSTVHGACYADYSHGIRLVSETALIDGKRRSIYDVLQDPMLARILNDEGVPMGLRPIQVDEDRLPIRVFSPFLLRFFNGAIPIFGN